MKIVMTLLVRDEEDILDANIKFHYANGVDYFIITDNRSQDRTPNVIERYVEAGIADYIYEGQDDYNQGDWVTRMARMAYKEHAADWVINNDADEFWWPHDGNLKTSLKKISPEFNVLEVERKNFVPLKESKNPFYDSMIYREIRSYNILGDPLPAKTMHRGNGDVVVRQGKDTPRLKVLKSMWCAFFYLGKLFRDISIPSVGIFAHSNPLS